MSRLNTKIYLKLGFFCGRMYVSMFAEGGMKMFDEFGHEDDQWRPEVPKHRRIIVKTLSVAFVMLVIFVITLMVVRLIMSKPPRSITEMIWTERTVAAYNSDKSSFKVNQILTSESFSEDGMFSINAIIYSPTTNELQVTVRYNDRVLNYLENDYPGALDREGEKYVFELRDNFGKIYRSYKYACDARTGYTYRRLIFEDVSFDDISALHLDVYYFGDISPNRTPRHKLLVYRYDYTVNPLLFAEPKESKYELFSFNP